MIGGGDTPEQKQQTATIIEPAELVFDWWSPPMIGLYGTIFLAAATVLAAWLTRDRWRRSPKD